MHDVLHLLYVQSMLHLSVSCTQCLGMRCKRKLGNLGIYCHRNKCNVFAGAVTGNSFFNDSTGLQQATEVYRSQVNGATSTSQTGLTGPNAVVVSNSGIFNQGAITGGAAGAGAATSACAGTTADGVEIDATDASCNAPVSATPGQAVPAAAGTTPATPTEATPGAPTEEAPAEEAAPGGVSTGSINT